MSNCTRFWQKSPTRDRYCLERMIPCILFDIFYFFFEKHSYTAALMDSGGRQTGRPVKFLRLSKSFWCITLKRITKSDVDHIAVCDMVCDRWIIETRGPPRTPAELLIEIGRPNGFRYGVSSDNVLRYEFLMNERMRFTEVRVREDYFVRSFE